MKPVSAIASRACGLIAGKPSSAFAYAAFLAASGALFVRGLIAAEGHQISVASVWAVSVATALPLFTSLVSMHLWNGGGDPERIELDLAVPVPERAFAWGRFAAAYAASIMAIALALAVPIAILPFFAPSISGGLSLARFAPACAALAALALPLAAMGSLAGACCRNPASAAVLSFAAAVAPWALYRAALEWLPTARAHFPEFPPFAAVADAADGYISTGAAAIAAATTCFAVYAASKAFAARRFAGCGRLALKVSSATAVASALAATLLFSVLAMRLGTVVESPWPSHTSALSDRTKAILSGSMRHVRVTAAMRRDSPVFVPVARLLRLLASEARVGAGLSYSFADPRWSASPVPLSAQNDPRGSIVFESGRRRITIPAVDADENSCASAIQRLSLPAKSEMVLFTAGHGEPSIEDFGPDGLGDAATALHREGYRTGSIFTATSRIPAECSVLAVIGARNPFSAAELSDVRTFLAKGGRLLATASADNPRAGIALLLESEGIKQIPVREGLSTTDGSDIVATVFGDHAVSRPLDGTSAIFAPGSAAFETVSSAASGGFEATPLCLAGDSALAIAAEKGSYLKDDLAIRPARIVAIGDSSFVSGGAMASRANSNREFLLNSAAWLSGLDISGPGGTPAGILAAGMDRSSRLRFAVCAVLLFPALAAALALAVAFRKNRRR